jgi:hypothetical protein
MILSTRCCPLVFVVFVFFRLKKAKSSFPDPKSRKSTLD